MEEKLTGLIEMSDLRQSITAPVALYCVYAGQDRHPAQAVPTLCSSKMKTTRGEDVSHYRRLRNAGLPPFDLEAASIGGSVHLLFGKFWRMNRQ